LQAVGTKQKAEYMWQGLIKTKRSGMWSFTTFYEDCQLAQKLF
jgi:hypothetical protein